MKRAALWASLFLGAAYPAMACGGPAMDQPIIGEITSVRVVEKNALELGYKFTNETEFDYCIPLEALQAEESGVFRASDVELNVGNSIDDETPLTVRRIKKGETIEMTTRLLIDQSNLKFAEEKTYSETGNDPSKVIVVPTNDCDMIEPIAKNVSFKDDQSMIVGMNALLAVPCSALDNDGNGDDYTLNSFLDAWGRTYELVSESDQDELTEKFGAVGEPSYDEFLEIWNQYRFPRRIEVLTKCKVSLEPELSVTDCAKVSR